MSTPFGHFQLLRKLATGGMGEVFLATERTTGGGTRQVALKRVLPHLARNPRFLDLFLEEARLASQLRHPNLVPIYELGCCEEAWYLTMEYVPGVDLRRLTEALRERGESFPHALAARIAADAAAGLHDAHQAKAADGRPLHLVHRDVSPHNLLLGFDGVVRVIDFGVARAARALAAPSPEEGDEAEPTALAGKAGYLSPEQVDGAEGDPRSDQFALAVVLWELLAGRRLFGADSELETLARVQDCRVVRPGRWAKGLPAALEDVVMRALSRQPHRRFDDCGALGEALEEVADSHQAVASWLGAHVQREAPVEPAATLALPDDQRSPSGEPPPPWPELSPWERCALAQLSLFAGSFTLEDAEAVASLAAFPQSPWLLDVIQVLHEKALLSTRSEASVASLLYELPAAVRAEGLAHLQANDPARARHQAWQRCAMGARQHH